MFRPCRIFEVQEWGGATRGSQCSHDHNFWRNESFPQILPHRRPTGKSGTIAGPSCFAFSTAGVPQQMHEQDHFCDKSSKILRPSMSPEEMVQRYLVDRELLKVRALFSVGMPALFLGAAPKDACTVCCWHVMFCRSNEQTSMEFCRLGLTLQK